MASAQEEILKIRLETEGGERIKALNALLDRQLQEMVALKAQFNAMDPVAFIAAEQRIAAAIAKTTKEIAEQSIALDRADRKRAGRLSVNDRTRLGFGAAQIVQDVASTGNPAHGINNILFMAEMQGGLGNLARGYATLGKEAATGLGKLVTAHPLATAAIAATGAGLLVLDKGLKDAELGWSDLGTVVANTGPWMAASEAISGTVDIVGETGLGRALGAAVDGITDLVHTTADYVFGWDAATEAAREHNAELARVAEMTANAAKARESYGKTLSTEQQAKKGRGEAIAQEIANLGGAGGAAGLVESLATGEGDRRNKDIVRLWDMLGRAGQGDARAAEDLARLAEGRGMDARGLRAAMAGASAPEQMGPSRQDAALLQAEQRQRDDAEKAREAARDELAALTEADDAENLAAYKQKKAENRRKADDIAGTLLGGNLGESIYAGRATEEDVADALRAAGYDEGTISRRSGQILESANRQAGEDIRRRALEGGMTEEQARLALRAEALGPATGQVGTFDAGSFVQQVQAGGAKDPAELMKAANEKSDRQIRILDEINRELRNGGRLGA